MKPEIIIDVLRLAHIVLQLARVNRVTRHEDGITPESDTDHTVMLALIAGAMACEYDDTLDIGLVVTYAVVHDLVEYLHGDTDTLGGLSPEARADKEAREGIALEQLRTLTMGLPWVHRMIERYERKEDREAVFVYVTDKVMPKITHALNRGVVPLERGHGEERMRLDHDTQIAGLRARFPGHDVAFNLFEVASEMALLSTFVLPRDTMESGEAVPVYWRRAEIVAALDAALVDPLADRFPSVESHWTETKAIVRDFLYGGLGREEAAKALAERLPLHPSSCLGPADARDVHRSGDQPTGLITLADDEPQEGVKDREAWISECRSGPVETCRVDELPPSPGSGDVWQVLIGKEEDPYLRELWVSSRTYGLCKYGRPLQLGNGRNHVVDAIQEAADGFAYASAADMEAKASGASADLRCHLIIAASLFREAAAHLLRAQRMNREG